MTLYNPCIKAIGPLNAKIVLIGEAPGEQEERTGVPFIGPSGQALDRMLESAGLQRRDLYLTNLLFTRPPGNKFDEFLTPKSHLPVGYRLSSVRQGRYLHPDLLPELDRLFREIQTVQPNLIITAGGPATWALLGNSRITQLRGAIHRTPYGKCLPILHPATVLYDWSNRPIIISDLMKAKVECEFPEIRRPQRWITIDPVISDLESFVGVAMEASILSVDIETKRGHITCIGFSCGSTEALVVPFYDSRKASRCYWENINEELEARALCNRLLSSPVPKLFQNGLYDIQYLLREGYRLRNCSHDTMILHHAMYPELPKGLGFLGSIYTNEAAWKLMRARGEEELKRDD